MDVEPAVRAIVRLFGVALLANFAWEMAQGALYAPMGSSMRATIFCFRASVADAFLVIALWALGAWLFRSVSWFHRAAPLSIVAFMVASGGVAVVIERLALATGRWAYGSAMPLIPGLHVGAIPVAQMLVLPVAILKWASPDPEGQL